MRYFHFTENIVKLFGRKGKVLRNIYVPKGNGKTSEIDVVFITQKGIFVIESKNYSGWIFGDETSTYWTVMLPNHEKNRFYNPIKQNRSHIKWLGEYLNDDIPLFSVIVFSERCELKKVDVLSHDIPVIERDRLYATIRNTWDNAEDKFDEQKVNSLYEELKKLTNVDDAVKTAHVKSIKSDTKSLPTPIRLNARNAELTLFFELPEREPMQGSNSMAAQIIPSADMSKISRNMMKLNFLRCFLQR